MPPDPDHTPLAAVDEVPEQPMVIAWEALDATTYTTTLHQLAAWVDWLVNTYEPPTQVIPPCWYAHPAQLEDLGHLWTGWLITRHPLSGVGMIGLDWDTRREHTFQRLRETVAATGCTSRQHNPPPPAMPRTNHADLEQHLVDSVRTRRETDRINARAAAATAVLADAELRHNHAPGVLRQVTTDPSAATADAARPSRTDPAQHGRPCRRCGQACGRLGGTQRDSYRPRVRPEPSQGRPRSCPRRRRRAARSPPSAIGGPTPCKKWFQQTTRSLALSPRQPHAKPPPAASQPTFDTRTPTVT